MNKKIVLSGIGLMFFLSPLLVSAQTIADLQAQIQALLAQIAMLQAQTLPPATPLPPDDYPIPLTPQSTCPDLTVTMQRGARDATTGGQVSELQIFLANYYDLNEEDVLTGYFGRATEKYVIRFQREQGLPTYGIVGSLTRAAIARVCGGVTPFPTFSASPTSGAAPLSVTFSWRSSSSNPNSDRFLVDFGDGESGSSQCAADSACTGGFIARHTYTSTGTYTARLIKLWVCTAPPGAVCSPGPDTVLGLATITVTSGSTQSTAIKGWTLQSEYTIGNPINLSWTVAGAPANTQVEIHLKLIQSAIDAISGAGGGSWDSKPLPLGSSSGTYDWITGPSYLEVAGTYEVRMYVVQCEPQGCNYNYNSSITVGEPSRRSYAAATPFQIKIVPKNTNQITVTSVVSVSYGQIVNTRYSNLPAGWNIRVIGVSGTAQALPVTSTSLLPLPGSYTGNSVAEFTVPAGQTSFTAIVVPPSAPAGAYVLEVSDPSSGWATKLRTPPFYVGVSNVVVNAWLEDPTGQGKEMFSTGDQLVIKVSANPLPPIDSVNKTSIELALAGAQPGSVANTLIGTVDIKANPLTYTWNVVAKGTEGNTVVSGRYYVHVYVYDPAQKQKFVGIAGPISINVGTTASTIAVTAPNGGEQWEIGQLNTITWSPYSYSPTTINGAQDVTVFLERYDCARAADCFNTVGKIMDTGKASLHTYFNINDYQTWAQPGKYYVRVLNRVTGREDRSDAPFTLLPRSVDLKINGSDGPVTVSDNQAINLSWTTANYTFPSGCILSGVRAAPGGSIGQIQVSAIGLGTYYAYAPVAGSYTPVGLSCADGAKGLAHTDYAGVISAGGSNVASPQVTSPNGGEVIPTTYEKTALYWKQSGLSKVSVALYKSDTWKAWIAKDIDAVSGMMFWQPGLFAGSDEVAAGKVFKIYITGQKADGTGYIDDKSDAPFGFVGTSITVGPKTNAMSCANPPKTGLAAGSLACYGLWDFGNEFGEDQNMCARDSYGTPKTGCKVSTGACVGGSATATRVLDTYAQWHDANATLASETDITQIAQNLKTTPDAVKQQLIRVWEYTCTGTSTVSLIGAQEQTDLNMQYANALLALEQALKSILVWLGR